MYAAVNVRLKLRYRFFLTLCSWQISLSCLSGVFTLLKTVLDFNYLFLEVLTKKHEVDK